MNIMQYKVKECKNNQQEKKENDLIFIPKMFDRNAIDPTDDIRYDYSPSRESIC
jgi:hypothetical protein